MRLVRAHIRGYRCLDDLRIDFDEVVVLVGANSTGKSSVLHALEWFFNGGLLDPEDLGGLDPVASVSVSATFADLSDTDAEVFGSYVDGEEMTLWRTWSSADGERLTGRALAYSPFETVRSNERRSDLNNAYRELREADPSLGLPSARSADAALVAMQEWEAANPDRLASSTVSATHLFGFAGHGRLAGRFDFVLIPAVSDPGSETRDARGTLLRQLVDRAGPHSESMRRRLDDLGDDLTRRVGSIVDEEGLETFDQVSNLVSGELAQLVPHGTVRVEPRMPVVRIPEIGFAVRVADGGIETELTRQGHGFQRALFIALVRQLAKSDGEGDGEFQRSVHGPGMIAGAVDPHRPLENPGCQARRCRCPNAKRSGSR
jgi:hypothetical protein